MADELLRVRARWDGGARSACSAEDFEDAEWDVPPSIQEPSWNAQRFLYGYVRCDRFADGSIEHECDPTSWPHRLRVCLVKKDNSTAVYDRVAVSAVHAATLTKDARVAAWKREEASRRGEIPVMTAREAAVSPLEREAMKRRDQRLATAYHEAGHAVAAWLELGPDAVHSATIKPDDEANSLGMVTHKGIDFALDSQWVDGAGDDLTQYDRLARAAAYIVVALAGGAASQQRMGIPKATGCAQDYRNVAELAMTVCGSDRETQAYIAWLEVRTTALVEHECDLITAVAEALLERETLTGDEVAQILQQSMLAMSAESREA